MTPPTTPLSRRGWLALVARGAAAASALTIVGREAGAAISTGGATIGATEAPPTPITVYKDASCGCCEHWVTHLRASGFRPTVRDEKSMETVKQTLGVPAALQSCHTAVVGGYLVEGHVPAADIRRMIATRPKIVGLAVPGMVTGSPGMEVPGRAAEKYDVLAFDTSGKTRVFARH